MRNNKTTRIALGAAALTMIFTGSAFTASNTGIEQHAAGTGAATVTGVNVTSIAYVLTSDRIQVAEVNFEHDNDDVADAVAELQLTTGGDWYTGCDVENAVIDNTDPLNPVVTTPGTISCTTTGQNFEDADNLTLVVGDNLTAQA